MTLSLSFPGIVDEACLEAEIADGRDYDCGSSDAPTSYRVPEPPPSEGAMGWLWIGLTVVAIAVVWGLATKARDAIRAEVRERRRSRWK
jgi:hypothetical protein